jgi:ABC-type branched-subunit amino acid transport system ATPase component
VQNSSLAGLLRPSSGAVFLEGRDITRFPPHARRRLGIGFLLQGGEVFASLTVQENIDLASDGAFLAPAVPIMELFPALRPNWQKRAGLLSGGERQMLALAMVLARDCRVLLLDEPTSALSPALAAATLRDIAQYCKQRATAVVLVEQRLREALGVASRAVALVEGSAAYETTEPAVWLRSGSLDAHFFQRFKIQKEEARNGQNQ